METAVETEDSEKAVHPDIDHLPDPLKEQVGLHEAVDCRMEKLLMKITACDGMLEDLSRLRSVIMLLCPIPITPQQKHYTPGRQYALERLLKLQYALERLLKLQYALERLLKLQYALERLLKLQYALERLLKLQYALERLLKLQYALERLLKLQYALERLLKLQYALERLLKLQYALERLLKLQYALERLLKLQYALERLLKLQYALERLLKLQYALERLLKLQYALERLLKLQYALERLLKLQYALERLLKLQYALERLLKLQYALERLLKLQYALERLLKLQYALERLLKLQYALERLLKLLLAVLTFKKKFSRIAKRKVEGAVQLNVLWKKAAETCSRRRVAKLGAGPIRRSGLAGGRARESICATAQGYCKVIATQPGTEVKLAWFTSRRRVSALQENYYGTFRLQDSACEAAQPGPSQRPGVTGRPRLREQQQ
ncbi:UNVERIFIED_CONTAM: hypothetical protein FKN15_069110 [Acipenser sinensis]